jgi:hypothetical protein
VTDFIFSRDPTQAFPEGAVAGLQKSYEREVRKRYVGDIPALLEDILYEAAFHYKTTRWMEDAGYLGADTLNDVATDSDRLIELLSGDPNRHRLFTKMLDTCDFRDASRRLDELTVSLRLVRAAALAARWPPRAMGVR